MMKTTSQRLREAEEKFTHNCREFAESIGVTPEPCTTRKPTPAEALRERIKLPWHGKVQVVTPADLTPELFHQLEEYGVFRADITELFGFKNAPAFYTWLRNNGVQISGRVGPRIKPLRSHDVVVTKRNGKAALEPKELEADRVSLDADRAAARVNEIVQEKIDAAIAGQGPIPGPSDAIDAAARAVAEQVAERVVEATREQVEEFFTDAPPAEATSEQVEAGIDNALGDAYEKLRQAQQNYLKEFGEKWRRADDSPLFAMMPHPVTVNELRAGGRQCGKTVMMSNPGRPEWPYPWPPSPEEAAAWLSSAVDKKAGEHAERTHPWPPTPEDVAALGKTIAEEWRKTVVELPIAEPSGLAVNQDHYNACGPIQPIEAMQASMDPQRFIGKLQGDIIKYAMRAGKKGNELADVEKIIQYSTWWAQALRGETINPREVAK